MSGLQYALLLQYIPALSVYLYIEYARLLGPVETTRFAQITQNPSCDGPCAAFVCLNKQVTTNTHGESISD